MDKVAPAVYAARLSELQAALERLKRQTLQAIEAAEGLLHEAHVAAQFAAGSAHPDPHRLWLDQAEEAVEKAGRELQAIARGGRRRR